MKKVLTAALLICYQLVFAQNIITVNSKRNDDNSVDFTYEKQAPGNYTLIVFFRSLDNAFYTPSQYTVSGVAGNLFTLKPTDKTKGISYSYSYRYIQGVHKSKGIDTSFIYLLPFQSGKTIQAIEHTNVGEVFLKQARPKGWKAYQFRGDGLDSVFAARKGVVVKITDEFDDDTISVYTSKTNNILIEHGDGSVAVYKGFKKGQITVKEGEEVLPQSFIGLIGSTPTNKKYLSFMLYYLSATGFEEGSKAEQTFVTPLFLTTTGASQLIGRQKYESAISNEVITKEMSRRQKKEFEKTKAIK